MNFKRHIVESGLRMLNSGLTVATWGNISVRDRDSGLIYLTPSGMPYNSITEDDVVVMDARGNIVEGTRKPTVEAGMHISVLNARQDINAVIHTHPVYSQVFACLHMDIPPINDEAAQVIAGTCRCTKYALPGSSELARNVAEALGGGAFACLIANHGAVCVGADMDEAFKVSTVLEMTAQIYQMSLTIGKPFIISDENVAYMRDFITNHYGQGK
ncbi:MAG: class II aldolase/adducin family protein [Oscillospiraceae bacterium]|nr:class II aldolase/adducin family protein [Oscillospiraceae bacterium]